jgi:pimeloyl-ACP methyl ester carboxylesterase
MNKNLLLPIATALAATLVAACSPLPSPGPVDPPRASSVLKAAEACPALVRTALPNLRITSANWVATGTQRARDPAGNREVGEPLPEHCVVAGRLDERTGIDGKPYYTGFELRLPTTFSGRLLYQGGGGNDGVIRNAVGRNTGATGWADHALNRGFAAVSTDAGHQSPGPEFGLDPQARIEHAYRAHQRTALTAKELIAAYYGRTADRSYFVGCSGGGRQGMMFTQRFPEIFDGVIAVAPAMRVSEGATIAAAWTVQKFLAVAPAGADGKPVLAKALEPAQLNRVAREIVERCDAADGLKDGLVHNPICRIEPSTLLCPAGGEGCLSAPQANALTAVMNGPQSSRGALYFGWPWDPGIAAPDWRNWTLGTAQTGAPNARHVTLMSGALGYEFVTPPDTSLNVLNFDFERDPARMAAFHAVYGSADDVQLAGMRRRGGKLMIVHGAADPIFSALESADYQGRINAVHGKARAAEFSRTFMVPGMNHCAGGPATDVFDGLAAMQAWVEQGQAPARLEARGSGSVPTTVSRPLCPWPSYAQYSGGDASSAASFVCRE